MSEHLTLDQLRTYQNPYYRNMRIQPTKSIGPLLTAGLVALPNLLLAQPAAHYPPGLEGIKAATLPPPGVYLRDYNYFYQASRANDAQGNQAAVNPTAFIYANVPRLLWITDVQVLGGYLGLDALVPIQYNHIEIGPANYDSSTFGIGDAFVEATLSWHLKQADLAIGYGVFAPTGNTAPNEPLPSTRIGLGYWTHMLTAGATWYIDTDKKWAISALNRYEFSTEKEDTEKIPGQVYTVEGGLSYAISKGIDIGPIAYYQQQVTPDTGSSWSSRSRVVGVGPEISTFFPQWMLGASLRYAYEVMSQSRLQGQTFTLTITKRF
jgi:hypothetical protein